MLRPARASPSPKRAPPAPPARSGKGAETTWMPMQIAPPAAPGRRDSRPDPGIARPRGDARRQLSAPPAAPRAMPAGRELPESSSRGRGAPARRRRHRRRNRRAGTAHRVEAQIQPLFLCVHPTELLECEPKIVQLSAGPHLNERVHIAVVRGPAPPELGPVFCLQHQLRVLRIDSPVEIGDVDPKNLLRIRAIEEVA